MLNVNNEVKKVLFIINKHAGGGYQPNVEGRILDVCQKNDAECTIEFTSARGHAVELAEAAVGKYDRVVAVGGDGTINEVARGLLHSDTPLGIIPRGSGNGLSRHLRIPLSVQGAAASLFNSRLVRMDTLTVNGRLSLNVSGIGFDAHVAHLFGKNGKRGLSAYARITLEEYIRFKEFEAQITVDGIQTRRKAFMIAIANSSQYGNNARVAPHASICDQLLHVNFLHKVPPYRLDFVYSFFKGTADKSSFCEIIETQSLHISVAEPMAFHVDGEPVGLETEFDIKILPSSLTIVAPKSPDRI
jgi:diacylglycerol kinase (ATP)